MPNNLTQIVELLLLLLIAASLVAMAARRLRVPYTIALVFAGVAIDLFHLPIMELLGESGAGDRWLSPEIIFMIFLPGLLFEAGININVRYLLKELGPILLVAIVGVLIAAVSTGYLVHWVVGVPLMAALVFGALISATDPISVLALFKQLGVNKRLAVLVEGESLFNDGTAVVLFQILLAAVVTGEWNAVSGVGLFLKVALGGGAIGLGLGYVVSRVTQRVDDPQIEITLTTILAYGSFLIAEHLHLSGVIAVVAAGLMIGNFGAEVGMSSRTKVAVWAFWEYLGFVINSLVFLLIGMEVHVVSLLEYWQPILLAIAAVLAGRALAVYPLAPLAGMIGDRIPMKWRHVMFWGGIHGGVSLALALSLDASFPQRDLILAMTFGVVAFSIVVQGLTVTPMMGWLGVKLGDEDEYDRTRVRQMALAAAITELNGLRSDHVITAPVYDRMQAELAADQLGIEQRVEQLHAEDAKWVENEERVARMRLLGAEKTAIQRALRDGLISHHTAEEMLARADEQMEGLGGTGPH
jgi:CPA1 family monovalent cation:H+ antiporter